MIGFVTRNDCCKIKIYRTETGEPVGQPPVAGFATMGRLQLSKDEDRDRDPEGTRTCHRCRSIGHLVANCSLPGPQPDV